MIIDFNKDKLTSRRKNDVSRTRSVIQLTRET